MLLLVFAVCNNHYILIRFLASVPAKKIGSQQAIMFTLEICLLLGYIIIRAWQLCILILDSARIATIGINCPHLLCIILLSVFDTFQTCSKRSPPPLGW